MPLASGLACALAAGACDGATGTIVLDLTTAPGSTVLDGVERLRVTATNPRRAFETTRSASGGFELAMDLEAGVVSALIVEGFDAADALVATGASPPFGFGPIDTHVVIYVATPMSVAAAPPLLLPARTGVTAAPLVYGAVFAGGRTSGGEPSDELQIYNVFDHTLVRGLPMPTALDGVAIGGAPAAVYLFGGTEASGTVDDALRRFDTTARPSGAYADLSVSAGFARSGERMISLGAEHFLITGTPPLELENFALTARTELAALPAIGASLPDGSAAVFVGGPTGLVRFAGDTFDTLAGEVTRDRAAIAALPSGDFVVVGGGPNDTPTRSALLVDPRTGVVTPRADTLTVGRHAPAVAATTRHLVVAGGVDSAGQPIATAEILDATTLAPLATLPIAARAGLTAVALSNGQVLLAGGDSASELLELFTPPPE